MKLYAFTICLLLALAGVVGTAHELHLDERIEPDGVWVFEAAMEDEPLAGAAFQVTTEDGQVLLSGALDSEGSFRWQPGVRESFKVVINAGLGHRLEETYDRVGPAGQQPGTGAARVASTGGDRSGLVGRSPGDGDDARAIHHTEVISLGSPLLGVALLLGAGGLWLSWRNTRRLNRLESSERDHAGRD